MAEILFEKSPRNSHFGYRGGNEMGLKGGVVMDKLSGKELFDLSVEIIGGAFVVLITFATLANCVVKLLK